MKKTRNRAFQVMVSLVFSLFLVMGAGLTSQAGASSVIFDYQHGILDEVAGTFTFDVLIRDIGALGNLEGWQLDFDITRLTDPGTPFSFHFDPLVVDNPDYVFYANSYEYDIIITPDNPPNVAGYKLFGGDLTEDGLGVLDPEGKLLATLILDEVKYCDWFLIEIDHAGSFFENYPDYDFESLSGTHEIHVVPIPGTVLLLGSGLIGFVGLRRKRMTKS